MKRRTIPTTDSILGLAAFWDTHDATDFDDQLEEAPERVFERHGRATVISFGLVTMPVDLFPPSAEEQRTWNSLGTQGDLEIVCFVPAALLPPANLSLCTRLRPGVGGQKSYRLMVEAMSAAEYRGLVTSASGSGEQRFLLRVLENMLILERSTAGKALTSDFDLQTVELKAGEIDLARQLIEQSVAKDCDPRQWFSTVTPARKSRPRTPGTDNLVSLEEAIEKRKGLTRKGIPQVKARKG
ncbi:MAG: hypothetical protein ABI629_02210 [bacterium]